MSAIELVVTTNGETRMVFDDRVDLRSVGRISIQRGSHVEPTSCGSMDRRSLSRRRVRLSDRSTNVAKPWQQKLLGFSGIG